MADNKSPPDSSSNSPEEESPSAPSKSAQSPPLPSSSSPPPSSPSPSSPPPSSPPPASPLPSSPPPSSTPPSSPPPASPPPSSPPPASPPPSSPPPASPPPSSPPPASPPPSSPPPSSSPTSSSSSPLPSPPPPSSSLSPPSSSQSPPPSPPPSSSLSSSSPPSNSPPPPRSNSSPPPSQNNLSAPPTGLNNNSSPPNNNSSSNNSNTNGRSRNNDNDNNGGQQWQPPPPPNQSSNTSTNNNGSGRGGGALSLPSETTNAPADSSPSGYGSMVTTPLVAAVAAGAGLLIIIMLLLFLSMRRKRNKREGSRTPYYSHEKTATSTRQPTNWQTTEAHHMDNHQNSINFGGNPYYNNAAYQENHNSNNQLSDLTAPPSGPGRSGWPTSSQNGVSDMSHASSLGPHGLILPPARSPVTALGFNQSTFTYDELAAATGGFAQSNLLGQGGFGYVHKGILPNGKEIAVKSLKSGSGQGEREFKAEVEIISRVHHRHLVSLVGYCIAGGQRMLVYEFLPNNNLEFHLHGKGRPVMDWPTRLKIALGSAKGLAYLHEDCHPRIIHRDIKTSNILLDFTFEAKVSDFGLAKLTSDNNTHVSTRVMGTFGYLAPEYASSGKLTEKSDVFSFGVMLLELITGRRPVDHTGAMEDSLVDWARPLCLRSLEDGNFNELADPYLEKNYSAEEMARMIACAAASIRHSARRRPKMSQIVRALEGDVSLEELNNGIKPNQASIFGGGTGSTRIGSSISRSSEFDSSLYSEDIKKLRKMVADNTSGGPYISSEYGATSEYGLNPSSSSSEFEGSRGNSPQVKSSFLK